MSLGCCIRQEVRKSGMAANGRSIAQPSWPTARASARKSILRLPNATEASAVTRKGASACDRSAVVNTIAGTSMTSPKFHMWGETHSAMGSRTAITKVHWPRSRAGASVPAKALGCARPPRFVAGWPHPLVQSVTLHCRRARTPRPDGSASVSGQLPRRRLVRRDGNEIERPIPSREVALIGQQLQIESEVSIEEDAEGIHR